MLTIQSVEMAGHSFQPAILQISPKDLRHRSSRAVRACTESGVLIHGTWGLEPREAWRDGTVVSGSSPADRALGRGRKLSASGGRTLRCERVGGHQVDAACSRDGLDSPSQGRWASSAYPRAPRRDAAGYRDEQGRDYAEGDARGASRAGDRGPCALDDLRDARSARHDA